MFGGFCQRGIVVRDIIRERERDKETIVRLVDTIVLLVRIDSATLRYSLSQKIKVIHFNDFVDSCTLIKQVISFILIFFSIQV